MIEKWCDVVGYEDAYEVSNFGRVRTKPRFVLGRSKSLRCLQSRLRSVQSRKDKRQCVALSNKNKGIQFYVHHLVLEAFIGPRPLEMECLHGDGDCTNNRLENLRWGTSAENKADQVRHGTNLAGERNGQAKLRSTDIPKILRQVALCTQQELADQYGVSVITIGDILRGHTWGGVTKGLLSTKPPRHSAKGVQNGQAKLNKSKVLAIRSNYRQGVSMRTIADHWRVSVQTIWNIVRRKTWNHV